MVGIVTSKAKLLMKSSLLRVIEFVMVALVSLLMMPFIIHSLGDKMYGLWIFVGSFLGYYGLMDFGLTFSVQRYVSRALGQKNIEEINKIINTTLGIFSLIGLIALFVSLGVAFIVPLMIKNIGEIVLFRIIILILGLNFAVGFPLRVFSGVLSATARFDLSAIVELSKLALRTILVLVFLSNGFGIVTLAIITSVIDISGYLTTYLFVKRLYSYVVISRVYFDMSRVKTLFSYSIYAFITKISDQMRFNLDNLVIVAYIGLGPVTVYSIGARLIRYFMDLIGSAVGMTMPIFSQYEGAGDHESIRSKFLFMTKISTYLSVIIGGMMIIFTRPFIIRWVGMEYVEAYSILLILLVPSILEVMQWPSTGLLYGLSKHKYYAITNLIEGIANLFLSIMLVKKYGIYGVALGTAIPMLIIKVFVQPIYTCKVIGIKYREFYLNLMLPTFALSLTILLVYWLTVKNYIYADYSNILAFSAPALVIFAVIVYFLGFDSFEKAYIRKGLAFGRK